jgi:hypothetical protein
MLLRLEVADCARRNCPNLLAYSRDPIFHDIHRRGRTYGNTSMTSHSLANVLGWLVLVVVLAAAVFYGPLGQLGKPPSAKVVQPAQPAAPVAPAPRGPVIKEVPN